MPPARLCRLTLLLAALTLCACAEDGATAPAADTAPADTVEADTSNEDTAAADTLQADTSAEDTAQADTSAEDTAQADTSAEDTAQADTTQADTSAEDTNADDATPDTLPTECVIDGTQYAPAEVNPADLCQACDPTQSATDWSRSAPAVTLLTGGTDPTAQGWSVFAQGTHTLTLDGDTTQLSTANDSTTSGALLLSLPSALPATRPVTFEVTLAVISVDPHNPYDSGAAILASYGGGFGVSNDRAQMLYLDADAIGWADDSQSAPLAIADGTFRTYTLTLDADNTAHVLVDGAELLTRPNLSTNGTIALGDQTNDLGVNSTLRIRSVRRLCP